MMKNKIHIALASDANYLPGLEVAKASILRSCAAPERIEWHIFDDTALDVLAGVPGLRKWNGSLMTYLRLWLPEMLHDVDWVIYSDVDTVWNRDVCELWDTIASEKVQPSIYWVRDFRSTYDLAHEWIDRVSGGTFNRDRYCCAGVCVLNLKKMRESGFTQRVLELFRQYGVPDYPDQDVLNLLFNRDSAILPSVWDAMGNCSDLPPAGEKCVYHITGIGRHFHAKVPPVYPPQYQLWWNVRTGSRDVHGRSRLLSALWPLHGLARLLPLRLRERIVRQWFFARVLTTAF